MKKNNYSKRDSIIEYIKDSGIELVKGGDSKAYALIDNQAYPIAGGNFKGRIRQNYYEETQESIDDRTVEEVCNQLIATARFTGKLVEPKIRVAALDVGELEIDLGNEDKACVWVSANGYGIRKSLIQKSIIYNNVLPAAA